MSRVLLAICLVSSLALGVDPYFGIRAMQPAAEEMISTYHMLPFLSIGARFPRSQYVAVTGELSGTYAQGTGDFSALSLWNASARFGAEFNAGPSLGAYLTPGVMVTWAGERMPDADTLGNIGARTYTGAGLGLFVNMGIMLFRAGGWEFNVECGADAASVLTDRAIRYDYSYYTGRYSIPLSGVSLGLVARRASPKAESGR